MFEQASRLKLRFPYKGQCTTEDLWDMPLAHLDNIFKVLNSEAKSQKEESLLAVKTSENTILDLQINIVKHVVSVRLKEQEARKTLADRASQKQKLLGLAAEKQEESLRGLSAEELLRMASEL